MSSQQQLSRMTKNELKKWLTKHNQRLPREERLKSFYLSRVKDYLVQMKKQTEAKKSSKKGIRLTPKSTAKRIVRIKRRRSNVEGSCSKIRNQLSNPSAQKSVRSRKKLKSNALTEIRKKRTRVRRATLDLMAIKAILNENELNNEDEPQKPELTSGEDSENNQKITHFCRKYELHTDPSSMTISELRSWLEAHNIDFEISGKRKQYYVDLVGNNSIVKQSNQPNFSASPPVKRYKTTPPSDKEKETQLPMPENFVHSSLSPPKKITRLHVVDEHNKYKENIRGNGSTQFGFSLKLLEKSRHGLLSTPIINKKSIQINQRSKKQMHDEILLLLDDDDDQDDDYMLHLFTAKKIVRENVGKIEPPKGRQTPVVLKSQHSLSPNKYSHVFSSRDYEYEDNDNDNDNENHGSLQRISQIDHKKNIISNPPSLQNSPQYHQQNLSPMRMPYENQNRSFTDAQSADLMHNAPIPKSRKKTFGLLLIISLLVAVSSIFITKFDGIVHITEWENEFGKHQVQLWTTVTDYILDLTFRLTSQPTLFCDLDSDWIENHQYNQRYPVECVPCPENALSCKNGILECRETYLIRSSQCIRDSKIIRYAYDIEQKASMILSELNGKKECGEDIEISVRAPDLKALVAISNENMLKESFEYFRTEILPHSQNIRLNNNHRFYSTKSIKSVSCMTREWAFKNALFIGGITAMVYFLACITCQCKQRQWINDEIELLSIKVYDLLEEQHQINHHEFMPVDRVKQALRPTTNAIWDKVDQIITKDSNIQKSMRMVDGLQKKCWKLSALLLPSLNASINYGTGASSNGTKSGSTNSSNQSREYLEMKPQFRFHTFGGSQ